MRLLTISHLGSDNINRAGYFTSDLLQLHLLYCVTSQYNRCWLNLQKCIKKIKVINMIEVPSRVHNTKHSEDQGQSPDKLKTHSCYRRHSCKPPIIYLPFLQAVDPGRKFVHKYKSLPPFQIFIVISTEKYPTQRVYVAHSMTLQHSSVRCKRTSS